MNFIDPLLMELAHEAPVTRRMLERIPEDKLGWKPHTKSMTLGRLASHIAEMPRWAKMIMETEEFVMDMNSFKPTDFTSRAQILESFDKHVAEATAAMTGKSNDHVMVTWRFKTPERTFFELPRIAAVRSMILNHLIHHRGQLSVYLRLNDIPLPPVYGPTADEQP